MRKKYYNTLIEQNFWNKVKYFSVLYNYFVEYEDPEVIIKYIYKYIYEILKEFKYIPHKDEFEDFHLDFILAYKGYYKEIIYVSKEPWIIALFPNPIHASIYGHKFGIKNFLIGIVGRIMCSTGYYYGDPATWNIGYKILIDQFNKSTISTCQYIFLENYSEFQIEEEYRQSLSKNYLYVIYKKARKYPGQPEISPEKVSEYRTDYLYNNTDKIIQSLLNDWKQEYNKEYNPRIVEACNKVFEKRWDQDKHIKPLYLYKEYLEEELESAMKEALKEEIEEALNEYKLKEEKKKSFN